MFLAFVETVALAASAGLAGAFVGSRRSVTRSWSAAGWGRIAWRHVRPGQAEICSLLGLFFLKGCNALAQQRAERDRAQVEDGKVRVADGG